MQNEKFQFNPDYIGPLDNIRITHNEAQDMTDGFTCAEKISMMHNYAKGNCDIHIRYRTVPEVAVRQNGQTRPADNRGADKRVRA